MKTKLRPLLLLVFLSTISYPLSTAQAQGTAFTYQGRLNEGANPATGIYDLRFAIYDALADGSVVGGPLTNAATGVTNGLFTVTLDFGPGVFTGETRWLGIAVRTNGAAGFTALAPRPALTPSPYAITASSATTASTAANVPASGIGAGTANISVTGHAGTATSAAHAGTAAMAYTALTATAATTATNLVGNVSDAQIPAAIPRLSGTNHFTGTNTFAGAMVATNAKNVIIGTFTGNGLGLTNLNTAQFGGTFSGNGAGLTNTPAWPVVNVKHHGAVGNGTANDTAALQSALNAASNGTANVVFIPRGTYLITNVLFIPQGVSLQGEGSDQYDFYWGYVGHGANISCITQAVSTKGCLNIKTLKQQWIRDLALRGPNVGTAVGLSISNGLASANGEQFSASHLSVMGFGFGVETDSPSSIQFNACYLFQNAVQVLLEGQVDSTLFLNCNLGYNATNQVHTGQAGPIFVTASTKRLQVLNCEIGDCAPILYATRSADIEFTGNNVERSGLNTNLFVLAGSASHWLTVNNNRIADNANTNAIVSVNNTDGQWNVVMLNNLINWGNHIAPVEGATEGPLLLECKNPAEWAGSFVCNDRSGCWRTKSGAAWTYAGPQSIMAKRQGAAYSPTMATRGRFVFDLSKDSDHATAADQVYFNGYFHSASLGSMYLAGQTNPTFGGTITMNGGLTVNSNATLTGNLNVAGSIVGKNYTNILSPKSIEAYNLPSTVTAFGQAGSLGVAPWFKSSWQFWNKQSFFAVPINPGVTQAVSRLLFFVINAHDNTWLTNSMRSEGWGTNATVASAQYDVLSANRGDLLNTNVTFTIDYTNTFPGSNLVKWLTWQAISAVTNSPHSVSNPAARAHLLQWQLECKEY